MLQTRRKNQAIARIVIPLLAALLLWTVLPASRAEAGLSKVGPVDRQTGFPGWIEDGDGLRLTPCLSGPNCPTADGGRVPYWSATATLPTNEGGSATLLLTTVGGYLPHAGPTDDAQQVMNRIRIQADNLKPGATYEVTHPYGVETFTDVRDGPLGIDYTEDVGCLQAPCGDFATALNGRVGPWLVWDTAAGRLPAGYIGDPSRPHKVLGSPMTDTNGAPQNYFEIRGPDIGGPGKDVVRTDLFSVEGRVSGLTALASPRSGSYKTARYITLTPSDPRAEIYYTTDGTEPTEQSTPYTKPLRIDKTTTIKFLALGPADASGIRQRSPVLTQTYDF